MSYTSGGQLSVKGSMGHENGSNAAVGGALVKPVGSQSPAKHASGGQVDLQGRIEPAVGDNCGVSSRPV